MEEKSKESKVKVWKCQPGFQQKFCQSNLDVVIGGAAMGVGKSFAALLMAAEPSLDPNFRMVCIRNNLQQNRAGGGLIDDAKKIYGNMSSTTMSDSPRMTLSNGSYIDFTHMSNQAPNEVLERVKGWQYDAVFFDEATGFEWSTFKIVMSRNRGSARWTNKIRLCTNPKKSHWTRIFLDWWIDPITGFVIPERDGVVRYFYLNGESPRDLVWGDSKEEVYKRCAYAIDDIIKGTEKDGKKTDYKSLIKSATLYSGKIVDNQELLKNNPGYIGSIAAMGKKNALANLQGSFNVDEMDDSEAPISQQAANEVFFNDPQSNGDRWITADLADYGNDNLCIVAWDCMHIIDIMIIGQSTPRQNAERIQLMAERHKVGDDHIIYDATAGRYINDYIPDAIPYISMSQPRGLYGRMAFILKDECYQRLVQMICKGLISCEEEVALRPYVHIKLKQEITVQTEFLEECSVVRFKEVGSGKKRLMNKKEMNQMLGKGRSMDLLDACSMRMYPILGYELGSELENTMPEYVEEETDVFGRRSIYDNSTWA